MGIIYTFFFFLSDESKISVIKIDFYSGSVFNASQLLYIVAHHKNKMWI